MSSFVADMIIYLLLFAGVIFGGISLLGLLIFPDIRSRMYTALRGGLICVAAILCAAVVYALARLAESGGDQYTVFLFHTLFLAGLIAVSVMIISRQMLVKTRGIAYRATTKVKESEQMKS